MKSFFSVFLSGVILSGTAIAGQGQTSPRVNVNTGAATQQPVEPTTQTGTQTQVQGQITVQGQTQGQTSQTVSESDRRLLLEIHAYNIKEIKAGLVAFTKDTTEEVRNYAWQLIEDHLKNERELQSIAMAQDINLASEESLAVLEPLLEKGRAEILQLEASDSAEFESVFVDAMRRSHESLLQKLDTGDMGFVNSEVGLFIQSTEVAVQGHIEAIETLPAQGEAAAG